VRQEEVRYLLELVHQLPSEKQELIALRFAGGLKVREIARVLDRSESAVKTELSRTLHYLKERYDESQR
jgi:RNA polymerase sigma-70 factor (ECF subfamily)